MIRLCTQRCLFEFGIVKNKTQNFFDMNPIYPDFSQKNFDIYNSGRKKINVIDEYSKITNQRTRIRDIARENLYMQKYVKFRRFSGRTKYRIDEQTDLALGIDSDFDDFVKLFKRDKFLDKSAKSQFKQTIIKLIQRFKVKSETELIRLFRISIANTKKKTLIEKLRGGIVEQAILKTAKHMKNYELFAKDKVKQKTEEQEQQQFNKILKQLDQKIEKTQQSLRLDSRGVPHVLSDYDPKYGWKQTKLRQKNKDANFDTKIGRYELLTYSKQKQFFQNQHDWSVSAHVNRLYFLKRLQFLRGGKKMDDKTFSDELPLNIRQKQKILNEIAHRYKEDELIQIPDLQQIYREVDTLIDNVFISVRSDRKSDHSAPQEQIYDSSPESDNFLWENISAQQILCESMYNVDSIKNIVVTKQLAAEVSPSSHTELSLARFPVNLYRHSQLESIGIFNEFRHKVATNLGQVEQMDFEPEFEQFDIQVAQRRFRKATMKRTSQGTSSRAQGKRKTAVAIVSLRQGTGVVKINNKPLQDYFGDVFHRVQALKPLVFTDTSGLYDVNFHVNGSGLHAQAEAMAYALARALIKIDPDHERILAKFGLVGYDFRVKEAKKMNLYSARKRPPYVRR